MHDLAAELRAELARQGKSMAWLAEKVGVTPGTISRWLSGARAVNLDALDLIGKALGVPAWQLMRRADEDPDQSTAA